jgi:photosystem II stability/assembly factor-like uncharacterized protein
MKKKFITIIILFTCMTSLVNAQWFKLNNDTLYPLINISFINANTGIGIGNRSIYKTSNGGYNWLRINYSYVFSDTLQYFEDVQMVTEDTVFVCGESSSERFAIMKSINGGLNWTKLVTTPNHKGYGMDFVNSLTGYVVCGRLTPIKTTDGGVTWFLTSFPMSIDRGAVAVDFINANTGYIAGEDNTTAYNINRTTNGGINWQRQFTSPYKLRAISMVNECTGFVVGWYPIYSTTNCGEMWLLKYFQGAYDVQCIDEKIVTVACNNGKILRSTDAGATFYEQNSTINTPLFSICFLNKDTGYAVGGGYILKTTNGGGPPIGIEPISNEIPRNFVLKQNYPNLFNPVTTIKFDIPQSVILSGEKNPFVKLFVYNILGQEVATLTNEQLKPGTYVVEWDGSNFSSGVYYYVLTAGDLIETKKMILVK